MTPPTTGAIKIKRGGDENITINHGCGGGDCGGGGNSGGDDGDDGDDGGNGGNGGGRESDSGVGCGRSSSPSTTAATGAAKTKETMKTIAAVGLHSKSLDAAIGQMPAQYCPDGRHG